LNPTVITFRSDHLLRIAPRFSLGAFQEGAALLALGRLYEDRGPAYSGEVDGKLIGACGIMVLWPGVGEAWAFFSADIVQYRRWVHRMVKETLWEIIRGLDLRRVQSEVREDSWIARKWVEKLGFKSEGLMPLYGPDGADYVRYAIVLRQGAR